jgi:hypothetical protein
MEKLLRDIDFGEPDANAEYIQALRAKVQPMYIRAWSAPEIRNYDDYISGKKFIISGQKGTGKTAILRHLEYKLKNDGYKTEFVVFKNEIMREAELLKIDGSNINGSVIEEDKLKGSKFYYHAIKRIMVSLLIAKLKHVDIPQEVENRDFFHKLFGSNGKEALRIAFDSIINIAQSAEVDVGKATRGMLNIDPGQLLKKSNDDLLNRAVRIAREENSKIRLFFDEMHFAFRDKESLKSDSALVRDTILATQALNERFAQEEIDIVVYIALRREFLEQPEIAQADVVHVVESYGETISWEHYPSTAHHPIFDFITLRFKAALGQSFSRTDLLETYLKDIDPIDILEYTWSKPRDLVRFFKMAQSVDGNTVVISSVKYGTIIRDYCAQAWEETKSALAAFIPVDALPILENSLKTLILGQFDGSRKADKAVLEKVIKPAFEKAKKAGVKYGIDEFIDILYIMGIFYYTYADANGRIIYQQYHRGNRNPNRSGEVRIHPAIAKALS